MASTSQRQHHDVGVGLATVSAEFLTHLRATGHPWQEEHSRLDVLAALIREAKLEHGDDDLSHLDDLEWIERAFKRESHRQFALIRQRLEDDLRERVPQHDEFVACAHDLLRFASANGWAAPSAELLAGSDGDSLVCACTNVSESGKHEIGSLKRLRHRHPDETA